MSKMEVWFVPIGFALLALICIVIVLTQRIERLETRMGKRVDVEISLVQSLNELADASKKNSNGLIQLSDAVLMFTHRPHGGGNE